MKKQRAVAPSSVILFVSCIFLVFTATTSGLPTCGDVAFEHLNETFQCAETGITYDTESGTESFHGLTQGTLDASHNGLDLPVVHPPLFNVVPPFVSRSFLDTLGEAPPMGAWDVPKMRARQEAEMTFAVPENILPHQMTANTASGVLFEVSDVTGSSEAITIEVDIKANITFINTTPDSSNQYSAFASVGLLEDNPFFTFDLFADYDPSLDLPNVFVLDPDADISITPSDVGWEVVGSIGYATVSSEGFTVPVTAQGSTFSRVASGGNSGTFSSGDPPVLASGRQTPRF